MAKSQKALKKTAVPKNTLTKKSLDEPVPPKGKKPFDDDDDEFDQSFEDLDYDNLEFDEEDED